MSKPISELLSYKYSKDPVKLETVQDLTGDNSRKVKEVNYRTAKSLPTDTNNDKDKVIYKYMSQISRDIDRWEGDGKDDISKLVGDYACRIFTGADVETWKKDLEDPIVFMGSLQRSLSRLNKLGNLVIPPNNRIVVNNIFNSLTSLDAYMDSNRTKLTFTTDQTYSVEGDKVYGRNGEIKSITGNPRLSYMPLGQKIDKSGTFVETNVARLTIYGRNILESNPYYSRSESYAELRDPYYVNEFIDFTENKSFDFASLRKKLNEAGYIVGYKNFAGFEMGTNHNWSIKIRPYESYEHGQFTCTPPLPAYVLPSFWLESDSFKNLFGQDIGGLYPIMSSKYQILNRSEDELKEIEEGKVEYLDDDPKYKLVNGGLSSDTGFRWFSYSENTPVLNYSLNFGTFKNESVRLFGGMTMEMFTGMNYSMTLNMSILDDSYGSMYKYMTTYINSIYDPVTNSVAPYYNMSFEIELTIFRTAGQISQKHKFIAVPIDFAPVLDGSQDANETRIDITFGIIGYIIPKGLNRSTVKPSTIAKMGGITESNLNYKTYSKVAKNSLRNPLDSMPMSDIKWGDVILNAGRDNTPGASAMMGDNVSDTHQGNDMGVTNASYFGIG